MIGLSTKATVPFTPPWLADRPDPPVFHFRVASVTDRDDFEAEMEGRWRAGPVYDFVLRDIAKAGVMALAEEDDRAELLDLIDQEGGEEELAPEQRATLSGLREILIAHWPEYRTATEQATRRNRLLPTVAFMTFCTGWDNLTDVEGTPLNFARDRLGRVDADLVARIPHLMLHSAGFYAYGIQYSRGQEKNSVPPSKSSSPPPTSPLGGASEKDGGSDPTSGTKIPA